jgi:acetamidase/formamidase
MNTVLTVEVVKGVFAEWPRLENDDSIMVAGSYRPLEDAFRIAHTQIVQWIAKDTGLSIMDTYQLVSQAARSRIANVCDANYTIVAKVPKQFLPKDIPWMDGVHQKMRARSKAVLASRQSR